MLFIFSTISRKHWVSSIEGGLRDNFEPRDLLTHVRFPTFLYPFLSEFADGSCQVAVVGLTVSADDLLAFYETSLLNLYVSFLRSDFR